MLLSSLSFKATQQQRLIYYNKISQPQKKYHHLRSFCSGYSPIKNASNLSVFLPFTNPELKLPRLIPPQQLQCPMQQ